MVNIKSFNNEIEVGCAVASEIINQISVKRNSLLMLATGATPTIAYKKVSLLKNKKESWDKIEIFKLDEWIGLKPTDTGFCEYYLQHKVLTPWGISPENYIGANGLALDFKSECKRLDSELQRREGADLCILGIGTNGHIGFNEPGSFYHRIQVLLT